MYSINEVAEMFDISTHTLRFYDKEGLLPFIMRTENGHRYFTEDNLEMMKLITCLRNTGMPIKKIKMYIDFCIEGPETVAIRRQILQDQYDEVNQQINELKKNLNILQLKLKYYDSNEGKHSKLEKGHVIQKNG